MDSDQPASSESTSAGESSLKVNLQIVSPSFGVETLPFPDIPASTTLRQLKERIRDALPLMRPANEQQRLIHRGRMLARDNDTLQDVFGAEALQTGDLQSLHLVVRDIDPQNQSQNRSAGNPSSLRNPSPAPGNPAPQANLNSHQSAPNAHQHQHQHHHHLHHPMHANPAFPFPGLAPPGAPPPQQIPQQIQHQIQQFQQQQHQAMLQWSNQLQREAGYRQLINQQQRERALMGYHGIQGNPAATPTGMGNIGGGRNSPTPQQPGQTVTREVLGPNGQYYRITETFNSPAAATAQTGSAPTSNSQGRGTLSPAEVQNIFRGADANQATQAMTNAMHRSASGASLVNMAGLNTNAPIQPIQPGVTRPISPLSSRHGSRTATPDPSARTSSSLGGAPTFAPTSQPTQQQQPRSQTSTTGVQPEVYILYSPAGPRGLLINNPSDMYITPAIRQPHLPGVPSHLHSTRPHMHPQPNPWQAPVPVPFEIPQLQFPLPPVQLPPLPTPPQAPQVPQPTAQAVQPQRAQVQAQAPNQQGQPIPIGQANVAAHPNNPAPGAVAAALWPHIWLIIRLTAFVWWFTSGDPSWSRWLSMVAIAVVVFVINTGILNGAANQAWDPFRRHLEGLLPLQNPNRPRPQDQQQALRGNGQGHAPAGAPPNLPAGVNNDPAQQPLEPNPAHAAARLLAERRNANGNWVMDQIRRVERAGLLFLASIAPGVAERHIANLEQQEREERRRREADEAAAAAAAATAALETARARLEEQGQGGQDATGEGQTSNTQEQRGEGHGNPGARGPDEPPPLIPV